MQRFTLLLLALITLHSVSWAQVEAPTQNVFVKHSIMGTIAEVQPYSNGLTVIGNDGTDDVVIYSADGETWTSAESLEAASASKLIGWEGSTLSFYYGNKASETEGLDLRLNNNGTASIFWVGGHASYGTEAITNVIRHDYGDATGIRYYYLGRTTDDMPMTGYNAIVYESDGTDLGTLEVTHNVGFGKTVKMTNASNGGQLESCVFNDKVHILAGMAGTMGTYSSVFTINYSATGSDISLLAQSDNESYEWVHMLATSNYIYTLSTPGGDEAGTMIAIAADGTYNAVNNGSALNFKISQPVQYGDRVIAIKDETAVTNTKVAIIDGPTEVQLININAEDESDEISNMTVSGNVLYFVATPTGGTPKLYSLDLDETTPTANAIADVNNLAAMVAIGDGYLAYTFDQYSSGNYQTHITKGVEYNTYSLYYGSTFYVLEAPVSLSLHTVGTDLYQIEYTGTETNIWKHTLDATQFPTANIQFTIKDQATSAVISGAELTISNGLFSYTGTSDASGLVTFMNIEGGAWYDFTLTAAGYVDVNLTRQWISEAPDNTKELLMEEDAATAIGDTKVTKVRLFPNPVSDVLQIESEAAITSISVYGLTGSKVRQVSGSRLNAVDVSGLASGVYIVALTDANNNQTTMKITKK